MTDPSLRQYSYADMLTAVTAWREARNQTRDAITGVIWAIKNRVAHPRWWGRDYVSVVTLRWQFSSMAAPGDPQLVKWPQTDDPDFATCLELAIAVIDGAIPDPTGGATSYYDRSIDNHPPVWATPDRFTVNIGDFHFYRVDI